MKNEKLITFDDFKSYSRLFKTSDKQLKKDYEKYLNQFKYHNFMSGRPTKLLLTYQTEMYWEFDFDLNAMEDWYINDEILYVKHKKNEMYYDYDSPHSQLIVPSTKKIQVIYDDR